MTNRLRKQTIGKKHFGGTIDITDPCYDKNVWCRTTATVKDGEYSCVIWKATESYKFEDKEHKYTLVGVIGIYLNGIIPTQKSMKEIDSIGVDAGLAGFFKNKPDYNDDEWKEFCDSIRKGNAWIKDEGFFSSSGHGDGCYPVYAHYDANNEIDALEIRFM